MKYLIYMQNSMKRRPLRHFSLAIIMIFCMMMPLMLSVFYSSQIFGLHEMYADMTKGSLFSLEGENISESLLPYFNNIPEITSWYQDGIIYLSPKKGQYNIDEQQYEELEALVYDTASELDIENLQMFSNIALKPTEETYEFSHRTRIADWVITVISLCIFLSTYGNHLHLFRQEIGFLRSIGTTKKQIITLFMFEFLFYFLIAAILSTALTILSMRLLFRIYLNTSHIESLDWIIYHVNPLDFALHYLLFFLCGIVTVSIFIHHFCNSNIHTMLADSYASKRTHNALSAFKKKGHVGSILTSFLLHRSNGVFISCAGLTALILSVLLFFYSTQGFHFLGDFSHEEYPIVANIYDSYFNESILSQDEIDDISQMSGIKKFEPHILTYEDQFLVLDNRMLGNTPYIWLDNTPGAPVSISCYSKLIPSSIRNLDINQIVISSNHKYLHYNIGDVISLQPTQFVRDSHGHLIVPEPIQLEIVDFIDSCEEDLCLDISVSDRLYANLVESLPIEHIDILLDNPEKNQSFIEKLEEKYPQLHSHLSNPYTTIKQLITISKGRAIISFTIFGLIFLFLVIVLRVNLTTSLYEKRKMFATLFKLGASRSVLYKATLHQSLFMCFIGCASGILINLVLIVFYKKGPYPIPTPTIMSMSIMLLSFIIILAAYYLPVYSFFHKNDFTEVIKS